jgi:hypothetical protein
MLPALMLLLVGWPSDSVTSGREVVRRMTERYAGAWFETLAAIRTVTYFDTAGGVDHAEVWYESYELPGTLRSDAAPLERGRGELFRGDSLFRFEGDTVVVRAAAVHVVLLLAFDAYRQPGEITIDKLVRFGFDLDSVREADWEGRTGWVVGREDGARFWVDRDDLLLRRLIIPGGAGNPRLDVRFRGYEAAGGGWLATERLYISDDRLRVRENEVWWQAGLSFPPEMFAPDRRSPPTWVRQ